MEMSILRIVPSPLPLSPSRFEGSLNVDLNEIAMNLVPFPKLHYLVSAISPLYISQDLSLPPRR